MSVLLLTSCLPDAQKLNPATYYRHDICFEYETGKVTEERVRRRLFRRTRYRTTQVKETAKFCGVGVLPELDVYHLKIRAKAKLNFFAMSTCHEENTTENPDAGIFKKDGLIKVTYMPTMEKGKACPLYISAFNRKGRHSWGMIVFQDKKYKMKAKLNCNGFASEYEGVSICQSRNGLIQRVTFDEPVKLVKPVMGASDRKEPCPSIGEDGQKQYTFKLPNRECIYGFIGLESKQIHKMYTIGYEDIVVRE